MNLIEKKCPNCGAGLEFSDSDKSTKCAYCKRSFEIERDTSKSDLIDQFDLKPIKAVSIFSSIMFFIMFIFVAGFIATVAYQVFNSSHNSNSSSEKKTTDSFFDDEKLITDVKDLSNSQISSIEHSSKMKISYSGEGVNDVNHSYERSGEPRREKMYVAYKKDSNFIIIIYRAIYHDFFHQENSYTVYVPVVFENVNSDVIFSMGSGEVKAPEYYFNSEKTSYTYGYGSFDEAYNGVVKPLENEYKITEK